MGCAGSKEADYAASKEDDEEDDTPPDFGVDDFYEVKTMLGEGGSGQTWLCIDKVTGAEVAIKFIKRPVPNVVLPMLMHEIKIQADLGDGHINLVSAKGVLVTDGFLGIIMEYMSGGNLTAYVTERWDTSEGRNGLFLTEDEARYFFRQYINAVEYLHKHRVAHRDLKLDNVVLDGHNPPRIKVCDFGFAKNWDTEANMHTQIGTPVYMSPQLISAKAGADGYDATKADIWACGILLFVMLWGCFPYDHTEHPDPNSSDAHVEVWMQQIKCSWRDTPNVGDCPSKLSKDCQDMLDKMFERDEKKRITIEQLQKHRWYVKPLPPMYQKALDEMDELQEEIDRDEAAKPYQSDKRDAALTEMLELAAQKPLKGGNTMRRLDLARRKPTAQGPSLPQHMSFAVRNLRPGEKLAGIEGLDEDPSTNGSAIKGSFGPLNGIDE